MDKPSYIIAPGIGPDGEEIFYLYLAEHFETPCGGNSWIARSESKDQLLRVVRHSWAEPERISYLGHGRSEVTIEQI